MKHYSLETVHFEFHAELIFYDSLARGDHFNETLRWRTFEICYSQFGLGIIFNFSWPAVAEEYF